MKWIRPALAAMIFALACNAQAERADREKPINLEADRVSIDDINKLQVYEGRVVITQGTMQIRTDKLTVTQDADGFQKFVAVGGQNGLARFRQKNEGKDEYTDGEGEKIVHEARSDKTEFFVRAWIRSGQDEVRGHFISYDAPTEKYFVTTAGGTSKSATGESQARVRAIIQPRGKTPPAEDKSGPVNLKPAPSVKP
jgi:lipopolysaccharide export system protein LptA